MGRSVGPVLAPMSAATSPAHTDRGGFAPPREV